MCRWVAENVLLIFNDISVIVLASFRRVFTVFPAMQRLAAPEAGPEAAGEVPAPAPGGGAPRGEQLPHLAAGPRAVVPEPAPLPRRGEQGPAERDGHRIGTRVRFEKLRFKRPDIHYRERQTLPRIYTIETVKHVYILYSLYIECKS